jgi:PD-(D/E)XK nuclease superfamily
LFSTSESKFNKTILTPSGVVDFKKFPERYLLRRRLGVKKSATEAEALGFICHEALGKLFTHKPADRTLQLLKDYFRSSWRYHRTTKTYCDLFGTDPDRPVREWDVDAERAWAHAGPKLMENYFSVEDPRLVMPPNPMRTEFEVRANLSLDPSKGVTGYVVLDNEKGTNNTSDTTFHMRGIVDRLDIVRVSKYDLALRVVDYKTGKAPSLKYSRATNKKIVEEAMYQLKIYALLLRENGLEVRFLRLLFLTSKSGSGQYLDMDLGATQRERDVVLQEIHADLCRVNAIISGEANNYV